MKRFAKSGERLFSSVTVRIFTPGNTRHFTRITRAMRQENGRIGITESGIDDLIGTYADWIDSRYPGQKYRMVELAPNEFNFVNEAR